MPATSAVEDMVALYERGARAWPHIRCSQEQFAKTVREAGLDVTRVANAGDLYITAALVSGDPGAVTAFDTTYLDGQRRRLSRLGLSDEGVDDALQSVRERLLLPTNDGGAPRIVALAGRGDFHALFRVVAVRTALNLLRSEKRRRHHEDEAMIEELCVAESTLQTLMQREAAQLLRSAIERAVRELGSRERTPPAASLLARPNDR